MPEQPRVLTPTRRPSTGSPLLAMSSFTRPAAASVSVIRFAIAIGSACLPALEYRGSGRATEGGQNKRLELLKYSQRQPGVFGHALGRPWRVPGEGDLHLADALGVGDRLGDLLRHLAGDRAGRRRPGHLDGDRAVGMDVAGVDQAEVVAVDRDRKSTRLKSSHYRA